LADLLFYRYLSPVLKKKKMQPKKNKWKTLSSEFGLTNPLFQIRTDILINPRNQKPVTITVLTGNDAANVVPITADGHILMIEQYRFGITKKTLEVPGGMVDDGENQQKTVERELLEETGYGSKNWHYLGNIPANPVFQDAYIHHWLAQDVELIGETHFDDAEDIVLKKMQISEVFELFKNGKIEHPHTVTALLRAFLHLGIL
jgi:ADP-ribose pyrophosphatase